ncbi:MAG TPA: PKD domain-containing protein [Candidatus Binataceae bacterium]|nr:PKD domain-containing protein [Candidatus Binataceae bacterium]
MLVMALAGAAAAQDNGPAPTAMSLPEMPSVAVNAFPTIGMAPLTVGFFPAIDDPEGGQIASYRWDFGDGTQATTPPEVTLKTYTKPGSYVASLTIVTDDGRSATGFTGITVERPAAR